MFQLANDQTDHYSRHGAGRHEGPHHLRNRPARQRAAGEAAIPSRPPESVAWNEPPVGSPPLSPPRGRRSPFASCVGATASSVPPAVARSLAGSRPSGGARVVGAARKSSGNRGFTARTWSKRACVATEPRPSAGALRRSHRGVLSASRRAASVLIAHQLAVADGLEAHFEAGVVTAGSNEVRIPGAGETKLYRLSDGRGWGRR